MDSLQDSTSHLHLRYNTDTHIGQCRQMSCLVTASKICCRGYRQENCQRTWLDLGNKRIVQCDPRVRRKNIPHHFDVPRRLLHRGIFSLACLPEFVNQSVGLLLASARDACSNKKVLEITVLRLSLKPGLDSGFICGTNRRWTKVSENESMVSRSTQGSLDHISHIESRVQSPESSRVQSPAESRVQSPESRVQSPESRVQSPESRVQSPESRVQSPESSPESSPRFRLCPVLDSCKS
ncbi:hypothetical protein ACROYT_G004464 [Oculina patagonica]